ncbi:hypothetical protein [Demequina sp. NBRC 110052]|uniref:hypothetical protein n=1 Tax=Demequina sp. NBRC 110052 TaxID=1570341 RepID=UPI000A06D56B|nr:hypothetical protein [Demequina sp. NBRC 110052]
MAPDDDALLDALAGALDTEENWSPAAPDAPPVRSLPGRHPGEALASRTRPVTGARALIVDCGTSRLDGATHVLWIAEDAPTVLGSRVFAELGQAIADRVGSSDYTWEGSDLLHLEAPDRTWEEVLRVARDAVASLSGA